MPALAQMSRRMLRTAGHDFICEDSATSYALESRGCQEDNRLADFASAGSFTYEANRIKVCEQHVCAIDASRWRSCRELCYVNTKERSGKRWTTVSMLLIPTNLDIRSRKSRIILPCF